MAQSRNETCKRTFTRYMKLALNKNGLDWKYLGQLPEEELRKVAENAVNEIQGQEPIERLGLEPVIADRFKDARFTTLQSILTSSQAQILKMVPRPRQSLNALIARLDALHIAHNFTMIPARKRR